jgi:hypothetical protein
MCSMKKDFTNLARIVADIHQLKVKPIDLSGIYNSALSLAKAQDTTKCYEILLYMKQSSVPISGSVLQVLK